MGGEEACPAHETPIGCGCLLSNLTGTPMKPVQNVSIGRKTQSHCEASLLAMTVYQLNMR